MKFLFSLILIAATILVQAQENTNQKTEAQSKWKTLEDKEVSIQYPADWELNQTGQYNTKFIILSPLEAADDDFRENINLLVQSLAGAGLNLDKYVELSEGQVKTMIPNSKLIESKRVKNGSSEFHRMEFLGDQGIYNLRLIQYYWIKNETAYVLTLTCEQTRFDAFKQIGEQILNSFKFLN